MTSALRRHLIEQVAWWPFRRPMPEVTNISVIYAIRHRPSGAMYIGSAQRFRRRALMHLQHLNRSRHHAAKLQALWTSGANVFDIGILQVCPLDQLQALEQRYVDELPDALLLNSSRDTACSMRDPLVAAKAGAKKRGPKPWVTASNLKRRGETRIAPTPERLAKMSRATKAKWDSLTAEGRADLSAQIHATFSTPEHKQRTSERARAVWARLSPEQRCARMAAVRAAKRETQSIESRQKTTAALTACWNDPQWREQQLAKLRRNEQGRWVGCP